MILGTASHVGKSLVAAGFCRLLAEAGVRVAPFKAQNMALNSFVTRAGGEIGRAQVAQAEAAGIEPHIDMNPILLKPMGGVSQVVLEGEPWRTLSAPDYYAVKDELWPRVAAAYDRLAARFDRIVLEGAGSPVEVNLAEHDIVNLRMARHAGAAIVLVADIERGGVFAQLVGTWELLDPQDRARVMGIIINKFRGDMSVLEPGLAFLRERTGVPVLGVLPFRPDVQIDQEDSLGIDDTATPDRDGYAGSEIEIVVIRLPGISNFTDFWTLARLPGVHLRYVDRAAHFGRPDLVILPGTRTTVRDLQWLRDSGLADRIVECAHDERGPIVMGVCGGFQILGTRIDDPEGVESQCPSALGLNLLDVATRFKATKTRLLVSGRVLEDGTPFTGYELHMAQTERAQGVAAWSMLTRRHDGSSEADGAMGASKRVIGTYVHGLFDSLPLCEALLERLRAQRNLSPLSTEHWKSHRHAVAEHYRVLAQLLRQHLDLEPIERALEVAFTAYDTSPAPA
jgi:adenosylcobyric acid synthase